MWWIWSRSGSCSSSEGSRTIVRVGDSTNPVRAPEPPPTGVDDGAGRDGPSVRAGLSSLVTGACPPAGSDVTMPRGGGPPFPLGGGPLVPFGGGPALPFCCGPP
ncbi:Uncharacterised protein [Mycobacteroides abscessus subsp. abscessus]|nr:Uncharacterised protein [Mycobacteroides abscessus subsp. abscessus]